MPPETANGMPEQSHQAVAQRIEQPIEQHQDQHEGDRHDDGQPFLRLLQPSNSPAQSIR